MSDRGTDRRWRASDPARLTPERRDGFDRRAPAAPPAPGRQGTIRPAHGEARPPRERRQYLDSGME